MSSMETKQFDSVDAGECIRISGSMCKILINGDVGEHARVLVDGSMGVIQVGGFIHKGAEVIASGSMGKIFHNGKHKTAIVEARGSMGSVVQQQLVGYQPRPPRPPKPPKPPRPPLLSRSLFDFDDLVPDIDIDIPSIGGLFTSSNDSSSSISVSGGHSVKIVGDQVWIDGKKVEPEKTVEPDPPVPDKAPGTVSVQKSARPKESWGT